MKTRKRMTIYGIVQGVGFRPYIHKMVQKYHLNGWILNTEEGVQMEIEGEELNIDQFIGSLPKNLPPLALIEKIRVKKIPWFGFTDFKIKKSQSNQHPLTLIPPDVSMCRDCLQELISPADRRYHYPFINCTNCGPRFSIIQGIPYDREKTTMHQFTMCPDCQAEYTDINDRRYHAQPNACFVCGPEVVLYCGDQRVVTEDPIKEARKILKQGGTGAIKGLGGFHLTCDAENKSAVLRLREIKKRDQKPFAVMTEEVRQIKKICFVSLKAKEYLESREKPVVLLRKKKSYDLSEEIAPNNAYLGIMLPYTPLHFLLLEESQLFLVMTSANLSDEPIMIQDQEVREKLAEKVDFLLLHNRPIYNRCDDSVIKISQNLPIMIRRSRGYAPYPIFLKNKVRQVLGVGPEDKNTACFTRDHYAFPTQHLGDLKNQESFKAYQEAIDRFIEVFQFSPEAIACDLHPDYFSTELAERWADEKKLPLFKIQHHFAHIASCMAEHHLSEKVIGVAFDGTGLGDDGTLWGGEFLLTNYINYHRIAHLKYKSMPGGERAIQQPWRMAYSYLYSYFGSEKRIMDLPFILRRKEQELSLLKQMIDQRINSPLTSSCGRLFDAVAALIGIRDEVDFEGQAAMELEGKCVPGLKDHYPFCIEKDEEEQIIDLEEMFREIVFDLDRKVSVKKIATKFHNTIAAFTVAMCDKIRCETTINEVVLSGGVFQNGFLLKQTIQNLKRNHFKVYIHRQMPPNDACISLGQAMIANFKMNAGH